MKYTRYTRYGISAIATTVGILVRILGTVKSDFNWQLWFIAVIGIAIIGLVGFELYYWHLRKCKLQNSNNEKDCDIEALKPFLPKLLIVIAFIGVAIVAFRLYFI
jgi:hypothetical protein